MNRSKFNAKKTIRMVTLEVKYPSKHWPGYDDEISKLVGGEDEYSGMGLGKRELSYRVAQSQYQLIVDKLNESNLEGIEIS